MRGNVHGDGQIWSSITNEQAEKMVRGNLIDGSMLKGQSLGKTISNSDRLLMILLILHGKKIIW